MNKCWQSCPYIDLSVQFKSDLVVKSLASPEQTIYTTLMNFHGGGNKIGKLTLTLVIICTWTQDYNN